MLKNDENKQNKKINSSVIITGALLAVVIFLFVMIIINDIDSEDTEQSDVSDKPVVFYTPSATTAAPTITPVPTVTEATASISAPPTQTPPVQTPAVEYTYGLPVPENLPAVDMDYFKDAIFVGDSRMEDFGLFTGAAKYGTFYAQIGLTLNKIFTNDANKLAKFNVNGERLTLLDALQKNNNYKKAYVMMGYNELGWPIMNFKQYYVNLLNEIRKASPDAIIYVYCVIPVGRTLKDADITVENNTRIAEYNAVIRDICAEGKYHYLNVQEVMVDSEGYLPDHAATDGIHPTTEYYKKWLEYTKTHTI